MKKNTIALALALVAGILCLSNFTYKWMKFDAIDYTILFAGLFIIAFGIGVYSNRKK